MSRKINIAIDGFSSCGKSTLAKAVAKELNYIYIDTGAMYRAMTLFALQQKLIKAESIDREKLGDLLDKVFITFKYNTDLKRTETYLNGTKVENEIRSMQVSKYVSLIAAEPQVRRKLVRLQQRMAESKGVVMDGRDIGTVVLPDAELKFFMTADPEVRAKRRYNELKEKGTETTFEEVRENIRHRDDLDSNRTHDPLRRADDAIALDNTDLTIDEQFIFVMNHAHKLVHATAK